MDTKGPISPSSQNNSYIFVIIDAFSHFVVTSPAPNITSKYTIQTLLHHWITKFGPPQYLVTDRGTKYINQDIAHLCSLFHINHSPRTPYSPWTNGLVEVQNRNHGTHLRIFLQNPRFLYLATHKLNSNPHVSNVRRRKEFLRLEDTNLELKFEITVKFHNLSPHPIPSHTTVKFKSLPHPFIATNFSLFVSDHPPFRLLHGSITFPNTLTFLKYTAQF